MGSPCAAHSWAAILHIWAPQSRQNGSVTDVLTRRHLNRATLARQMLLERADASALDAIRFLVGLQAQEPPDPYIGLWSRLTEFDTGELEKLILDRDVVRLVVQRGTVHAVTADDCWCSGRWPSRS